MRGCKAPDCDRKHSAKGLCGTHYERYRRTGSYGPRLRPPLQERVLDALNVDGGWLTADGIALMIPGTHPDSVRRVCRTLTEQGVLARREVELAATGKYGNSYAAHHEWRVG